MHWSLKKKKKKILYQDFNLNSITLFKGSTLVLQFVSRGRNVIFDGPKPDQCRKFPIADIGRGHTSDSTAFILFCKQST